MQSVNGRVPPRRLTNRERRPREYLTQDEVTQLIKAAQTVGRHGHRDAALILLMFRHGLRVSEAVALEWDQVDLEKGLLQVRRRNNGVASGHRLLDVEIRALRRLRRDYSDTPHVFVSERKAPLSAAAVRKILARAGKLAEIAFPVHPHQLRHATGYMLASQGIDARIVQRYLGHKKTRYAARYFEKI